jgi:hypothetical protein
MPTDLVVNLIEQAFMMSQSNREGSRTTARAMLHGPASSP